MSGDEMSDETLRNDSARSASETLAAGRQRVERSRNLIGLIDLLLRRKDEPRAKKPPQQ